MKLSKLRELKKKFFDRGQSYAESVAHRKEKRSEAAWRKEFGILEKNIKAKSRAYEKLAKEALKKRHFWDTQAAEMFKIRADNNAIISEHREILERILRDLSSLLNLKKKLENNHDDLNDMILKVVK